MRKKFTNRLCILISSCVFSDTILLLSDKFSNFKHILSLYTHLILIQLRIINYISFRLIILYCRSLWFIGNYQSIIDIIGTIYYCSWYIIRCFNNTISLMFNFYCCIFCHALTKKIGCR